MYVRIYNAPACGRGITSRDSVHFWISNVAAMSTSVHFQVHIMYEVSARIKKLWTVYGEASAGRLSNGRAESAGRIYAEFPFRLYRRPAILLQSPIYRAHLRSDTPCVAWKNCLSRAFRTIASLGAKPWKFYIMHQDYSIKRTRSTFIRHAPRRFEMPDSIFWGS